MAIKGRVTKRMVDQAAGAFQEAQRVWGTWNMETDRREWEYRELLARWEAQKAKRAK
jgi:hypothetical protein